MKLNFLKFALLSIILVAGTSCVKDNVDSIEGLNGKTASFQIAQSRLALDGTTFAFETGDKVGVSFNNDTDLNLEGNVTVEGDVATVTFTYTGEIAGESMVAYHPYNAANNGKAFGSLTINVSPRQTQPADGEFDGASLPLLSDMIIYGGDNTAVAFQHLGAVVKFNVYGNDDEKVKNVSIATDNQGKVFSSGNSAIDFRKNTYGTPDDNGVDVTLATPTNSGASKAEGTVAYASIYGISAGERANNVYVAVTTDKALYTWTRNITVAKGAGQVLNLDLETADDEYPVKTYTTTPEGRLASQIYNDNGERNYVMGERTWMAANLRWRGYTEDLGIASTHATHAKEFGTYYNYYEAVSTIKDATWALANNSVGKEAMAEITGVDEMGLSMKYTFATTGVGQDKAATTKNINIALSPTSDAGKTLRGQWQFVCPKGWHLSNYTDWYHLMIAVGDTYARGTSWSGGEPGFSGSYFDYNDQAGTSPKNPFCNAAISCRVDDTTEGPRNMGFVFRQTYYCLRVPSGESEPTWGDREDYWGISSGAWLRASVNQLHGGLWLDDTSTDTTNGWYHMCGNYPLPLYVTNQSYTDIYAAISKCNPATYLVNAGYGTDKVGAEFVGFNAYPAGYGNIGTDHNDYCKYACFLQPMTINALKNNGTTAFAQIDYNQNGLRMIAGKGRTVGTNNVNKVSVRCVKNYEHYDLK